MNQPLVTVAYTGVDGTNHIERVSESLASLLRHVGLATDPFLGRPEPSPLDTVDPRWGLGLADPDHPTHRTR